MAVDLTCKICNKQYDSFRGLANHITRSHKMSTKQYYDTYFKTEDEGKCLHCGKPTKFKGIQYTPAYRSYCCSSCAQSNSNKFIKIRNTNLARYGTACTLSLKSVQQKARQTKASKYNNEYYCNSAKIRDTINKKTLKKYRESVTDSEILDYSNKTFTCKCLKCNKTFTIGEYLAYLRHFRYHTPLCTYCNKLDSHDSSEENNIANYLASITTVQRHNRTILEYNKELDIFLPDKNIAIEYNGLYWHSELRKSKTYHVDKTNECEKHGIHLIHIFEDDWLHKQDIVKSRLNNLLGISEKIFARKCDIRIVSFADSKEFLEKCHIQGNCVSSIRYGLYYNDELVSLMTFGKSRFNSSEYELLRFCNKLNTTVVGGASRLFKHFLREHPEITSIVSYADRCWSIGGVYEKLGFTKLHNTAPNYYYIIDNIRINRMNFQKKSLITCEEDKKKTEHDLMLDRNICRIYDCGNIKYVYNRE